MSYNITLVGAVGGSSPYQQADILRLLNVQPTTLLHGNTFTGRPGTQIYTENETVLKIRSEIRLEPLFAKRWAQQILAKETHYQIYHPHKTWFVAETTEDKLALVGSICPRLQPLHSLLNQNSIAIAHSLNYFNQLFDHYFRLAKQMKIRLDEGLSNFGVDAQQELFYLDDDIYTWDRFISCAQMLGVYFRSLPWFNPAIATQLGKIIHQLILKHFNDAQYLVVLAEQLKDVYMPADSQRQVVNSFINQLVHRQPSSQISNLSHNRYIALLADIHANLPALQVVLNFLKLKDIQTGIVLGDIVGYGPHPSQCIEQLQQTGFIFIKGNHDHGLASDQFEKSFSRPALWALQWSAQQINQAQKSWLADLSPLIYNDYWLALHGAPIDPTFFNAYVYEMTYSDNLDVLQRKAIPICFHGHTHRPGIYGRSNHLDGYFYDKVIDLKNFNHALICPGSVGQPRNRPFGAQFAIYDQKERKIYYHNLPYNVTATITAMEASGFPDVLIAILKKLIQ